MDYYARFVKDLKSEEHDVNYVKDDGTRKTRYYVAGESEDKYFIVKTPNDINSNQCCSFDKKCEGKQFILVQE